MKKCLFALSALLMTFAVLSAQPPQGGSKPAPPKMKSPEEIAKCQADMMKSELGITDKQYKKVYNLIKKDHETRQNQYSGSGSGFPPPPGGGMPPSGGPGMGGPGGGMPPSGGPGMGGSGGGRPPKDGQMPEGFQPYGKSVSEEYLEKQEQKLKKILTPEQYSRWRKKHPAEHHELPPVDFN